MSPINKPITRQYRISYLFLTFLLIASLIFNGALVYLFYRGLREHKSTIDLARGLGKYFHIAPPFGRYTPERFQAERPCRQDANTTILVMGQSNAANSAYSYTKVQDPNAAAFYNGRCYALFDPVPGGDGTRGSQWPDFADLFHAKFNRSITLIVASWGSTSIHDWSRNGFETYALGQAKQWLAKGGKIDAVFWQQGEADVDTDAETYAAHLQIIIDRIRALPTDAPIFIAQATLQNGHINEAVREVQRRFGAKPGMAAGPDADKITDRYDNVHLGAQGARDMAKAWLNALADCACISSNDPTN